MAPRPKMAATFIVGEDLVAELDDGVVTPGGMLDFAGLKRWRPKRSVGRIIGKPEGLTWQAIPMRIEQFVLVKILICRNRVRSRLHIFEFTNCDGRAASLYLGRFDYFRGIAGKSNGAGEETAMDRAYFRFERRHLHPKRGRFR